MGSQSSSFRATPLRSATAIIIIIISYNFTLCSNSAAATLLDDNSKLSTKRFDMKGLKTLKTPFLSKHGHTTPHSSAHIKDSSCR
jgi:hypothetical protein